MESILFFVPPHYYSCKFEVTFTFSHLILMIKLRLTLFVTYTIIQSITSSEMCSLHLTHPSAHTWSSGQSTLRRPGSSWRSGALLKGLTSVVDNSCRSRDLNPRITSPTPYPLGHDCPITSARNTKSQALFK